MSFELNKVLWVPAEELSSDNLQPILSTVTDEQLGINAAWETGLIYAGRFSSERMIGDVRLTIGTRCLDFEDGRTVLTDEPLLPEVLEAMDVLDVRKLKDRERWFRAGGHIVQVAQGLTLEPRGLRRLAQVQIFGPEA